MRSAVTSATTPDPDVTRRAAGNLSCPRRRIAVGLSGIPRPMINWANFISQCFNGLVLGALLALVASGLTIIYGTLGVLNLAHGAMFMLGGYAGWLTYSYTGSFVAAVLAAAVFVMIVGVLVERVIIRHFYNRPHEDQLLVTFGLGIVFVEPVRFLFGSLSKTGPPPTPLVGITPLGFMFLSDLSPRAARHRRGRAAGSLSRALSYTHRHDRAHRDRGRRDGRFAGDRCLQGVHAGVRHREHGGRLRGNRQCASGLDRARCRRRDFGADFRGGRHRRGRLILGCHPRRLDRRRDH